MVIVSREKEPAGIGFGEKNLPTLAPGRLVKVASAGSAFVTPLSVVTAPDGMVFVRFPFTVMVALRVNTHLPRGGRVPPLNENVFAPGEPLMVPPHVPTFGLTGLYRIMFPGMLSVKAIFVSVALLGLINSILIVEAAPPVTINGSKPFTISIAAAVPPVTLRFALRLLGGTRGSV